MAKRVQKSLNCLPVGRRVIVSDADATAARRLLSLLIGDANGSEKTGRSPSSASAPVIDDPAILLAEAWRAYDLRQRRLKILGKGFRAEAPFAILLTLYVTEKLEPINTISRLSELAMLSLTTLLRWLDELIDGEWIERTTDKTDGRSVHIALTSKARLALGEVFGRADERPGD